MILISPSFACPVCSRSACDMSDAWKKLDEEVAATPMPEFYQKKMVSKTPNISPKSRVPFFSEHFFR
jgi:hypothetical protein